MPGPADYSLGNVKLAMMLAVTLSPASVANATSAEQTFPVPGLCVNDIVTVNKPTAQAGLGIVGSRVSASNVLAITFMNATSATITPTASQVYLVSVVRGSNPQNLPSAIA